MSWSPLCQQWSNWEMVADEKLERPLAGKLRGWQSGKRVLTRSSRIIVINSHAINMTSRGNETRVYGRHCTMIPIDWHNWKMSFDLR